MPASFACAVLAEPIVRLLYQRGEFTPTQTTVVADALAAFSLGLAFNGAMLMLNRAFFSLQSNWLPDLVALGNLALNAVLDCGVLLVRRLGDPARDLARQHRRHGGAAPAAATAHRPDRLRRPRRRTLGLVTLASCALAAVAWPLWDALDAALGRSVGAQFVSLGAALAAGSVAYLLACRALRVHELEALLALRTRFRRV